MGVAELRYRAEHLENPIYAGAYAFGRTRSHTTIVDQTNYRRDTTMKTTRTQILTPAALAFACGGRGET